MILFILIFLFLGIFILPSASNSENHESKRMNMGFFAPQADIFLIALNLLQQELFIDTEFLELLIYFS